MSTGKQHLLNVGLGNFVVASRVVAVVNPASSPMRRLREEARQAGRIIDATQGRKTRSLIITDSNHVILSAVQAETMRQRFQEEDE
ncbi:extracellular matrix/biofilm biosynthesis regulator RemA family protein [Desulfovibrio cuneatus]|uniref:extracellular matrix/biofilm biosynthesis regulator RemA family protein n=1 Tax=Desulfovibrio cuneatus TaxID=159728 RepID=UPI000483788F|nr:extracellular matrix/biofilm biosynthesis regulator RemA family protein [Desulfovibrio cuneatus]